MLEVYIKIHYFCISDLIRCAKTCNANSSKHVYSQFSRFGFPLVYSDDASHFDGNSDQTLALGESFLYMQNDRSLTSYKHLCVYYFNNCNSIGSISSKFLNYFLTFNGNSLLVFCSLGFVTLLIFSYSKISFLLKFFKYLSCFRTVCF